MKALQIEGTSDTPKVGFDASTGILCMEGKCLPESIIDFFSVILKWLDGYAENPQKTTIFDFKLTYFNTASSKMLLDVMMRLNRLHLQKNDVLVRWHFPDDDEDMEEAGEEYAHILKVPFEHIAYKAE